jgi:hypothetical protein
MNDKERGKQLDRRLERDFNEHGYISVKGIDRIMDAIFGPVKRGRIGSHKNIIYVQFRGE